MTMTTTAEKDEDWTDGAAAAASCDFVRFTLADIHGVSRSKIIPRRHVDEKLKNGITMCAGTTPYRLLLHGSTC